MKYALIKDTFKRLLSSHTNHIEAYATPGLITLLDYALYKANEGGLTSTVSSADVLLAQVLELKQKAQELLFNVLTDYTLYSEHPDCCETLENFARLCIECANGMIEHITTDKLALASNVNPTQNQALSGSSAVSLLQKNLSSTTSSSPMRNMNMNINMTGGDSNENNSHSNNAAYNDSHTGGMNIGVKMKEETCMSRSYNPIRRRDCYETPRLICPDYVWAEDVILYSQRALKAIQKHPAMALSSGSANVVRYDLASLGYQEQIDLLYVLSKRDLPSKLSSFRFAVSADTVTSKRMYLVKCEYRAPFRAFLENHRNYQRAPDKKLVDEILALYADENSFDAKEKLNLLRERALIERKEILEHPTLLEGFQIEHVCEVLELGMMRILHPFAELARLIEGKHYRLKEINGLLAASEVASFRELVRRLKFLIVRKSSQEPTGIRPLLLDLQGVSRKLSPESIDIYPFGEYRDLAPEKAMKKRIDRFLRMLSRLSEICRVMMEKDLLSSFLSECERGLDPEMFYAQYEDWYNGAKRQTELLESGFFDHQPDILRRSEVNHGVLKAPYSSLEALQGKLESLKIDRMKRFEFLRETVTEVCQREIGCDITLMAPDEDVVLKSPETTVLGVFGARVLKANEIIPIG